MPDTHSAPSATTLGAAAWIAAFDAALVARDSDAVLSLFQDDCYWRDLLAFTWTLRTAVMSVAPPGAGIAAEALTHHLLMPLCTYLGLHLEGVAMDEFGMLPAGLHEVARRVTIRAG